MPFATGKYTLRASIVGGFGNKFATGNGIDKVVTTQVPSTIGAQVWDINAVEGKEGVYTITVNTNWSTSGGSWSLYECSSPLSDPVILSEKAYEWYIYSSDEVPDAVIIRPVLTNPIIDSDLYVGTDENQVVIKYISKYIPVVPGEGDKIPYWVALQKY